MDDKLFHKNKNNNLFPNFVARKQCYLSEHVGNATGGAVRTLHLDASIEIPSYEDSFLIYNLCVQACSTFFSVEDRSTSLYFFDGFS